MPRHHNMRPIQTLATLPVPSPDTRPIQARVAATSPLLAVVISPPPAAVEEDTILARLLALNVERAAL
jgi:hypothetical protein